MLRCWPAAKEHAGERALNLKLLWSLPWVNYKKCCFINPAVCVLKPCSVRHGVMLTLYQSVKINNQNSRQIVYFHTRFRMGKYWVLEMKVTLSSSSADHCVLLDRKKRMAVMVLWKNFTIYCGYHLFIKLFVFWCFIGIVLPTGKRCF